VAIQRAGRVAQGEALIGAPPPGIDPAGAAHAVPALTPGR
jgi:isoquinoline 1-oxidoreductase alpha subunit